MNQTRSHRSSLLSLARHRGSSAKNRGLPPLSMNARPYSIPYQPRWGVIIGLLIFLAPMPYLSTTRADDAPPTAVKPAPPDLTRGLASLNKNKTIYLDPKGKRLLMKAQVVLREGLLEMLVCLKHSKEHESLLAVDTQAQIVHAGLLALGAKPGSPVQWDPEYQSPTGQTIDIFFNWTDETGQARRVPAQEWVRHATRRYYVEKLVNLPETFELPDDAELKWDNKHKEILWYGHMTEAQRDDNLKLCNDAAFREAIQSIYKQSEIRPMSHKWVFAGSHFFIDDKTGEKFYQAESGDLICVANFATATLDLSVNSSSKNNDLMFEAYTEHMPPVGTEVIIELIPAKEGRQQTVPKSK